MSGGRSVVGERHARVCEVEDSEQLLWTKSHGARLYAHQEDFLDRRPVCSHSISRDSGSRHEGCRDCDEGTTKDQTW